MYNQPLPFDPQNPQWPFLQLTLNNPPFVPQNPALDPYLQQMLPTVAAAAAIEVQSKAQNNPLRMFMFNQCAQNNFCNQPFEQLVLGIMDYITLGLHKRTWPNPDAAAQQAITQMTEMLCAINLRMFPALEQFLDPNLQHAIRNTIGTFDSIVQEITMMQNQMRQGGYGNTYGMNRGGMTGMSGQFQQMGGPRASMSGGQQYQQQRPMMGTRSTFSGTQQQSNTGGISMTQKFDPAPLKQPFESAKGTTMTSQQETKTMVTTEEFPAIGSKVDWKPNIDYPYFPAYNPLTMQMFFKINPLDNSTIPLVRIRTPNEMEYDRHTIPSIFGKPPKGLNLSPMGETLTRINEGVQQLNAAAAAVEINSDDPVAKEELATFVLNDRIVAEMSEDAAWFAGSMERLRTDGTIPDIYRVYARIATPIVSMTDETSTVQEFASAKTLIALREVLMASVGEMNPELWTMANTKITNKINSFLRQELSLPKLSIDSFVEDIADLIDVLGEKDASGMYGPVIQEIFLKHQRNLIATTFQLINNGTADSLTAGYMPTTDDSQRQYDEGKEPKVTYLASDCTLTYLNCLSYELEVELVKGVGSAVTEQFTPDLWRLVISLFNDVDKLEAGGALYDRHLIRTSDGRILEAAKGAISDGFYVLTMVK